MNGAQVSKPGQQLVLEATADAKGEKGKFKVTKLFGRGKYIFRLLIHEVSGNQVRRLSQKTLIALAN